MGKGMDTGKKNKADVLRYYMEHGETSKSEIVKALGLSMPTVMRYTNELLEEDILRDMGTGESTGGRKAGLFSVNERYRMAAGIDITANHVSLVLVNLRKEIVSSVRYRTKYEHKREYYEELAKTVESFLDQEKVDRESFLGIGIALPGIVDKEHGILTDSHVLGVRNFSFSSIRSCFPYELFFENDAVSAALAETISIRKDMIYLSLSNSVGGAIYLNGNIYAGDRFKSAEFGHMTLHPKGKKCYCQKLGCVDAYCNASLLSNLTGGNLGVFFERLQEGDEGLGEVWNQYLEELSLTISNLRMAFDCDIILGGYVGSFMEPYILDIEKRVSAYDPFEGDTGYIHACTYRYEAAALGSASAMIESLIASWQ